MTEVICMFAIIIVFAIGLVGAIYATINQFIPQQKSGTLPVDISTESLSVAGIRRRCTLTLTATELIVPSGPVIPLRAIEALMFQVTEQFVGFGVVYSDRGGRGRVSFINEGYGQVKRTRRILNLIQDARFGIDGTHALVIDAGAEMIAAANNLVHRS